MALHIKGDLEIENTGVTLNGLAQNVAGYYISYNPDPITPLSAGGWRNLFNNITTDELDEGYYLITAGTEFTLPSSGTGTITARLVIDGSERVDSRQTIPTINGYYTSAICVAIVRFNTKATHTINVQAYPNVKTNFPYKPTIRIIKI